MLVRIMSNFPRRHFRVKKAGRLRIAWNLDSDGLSVTASPRPTGVARNMEQRDSGSFFRLRHRSGKGLRDWIEIDDLNAIFR